VHYPAGSQGESDSSSVHLFYQNGTNLRNISIDALLNHVTTMTNGPLSIPANTVKVFDEQFNVPFYYTASVIGVFPHMHLIGKDIASWAIPPTGDTIKFIRINNWDFHWQGTYYFQKVLKLPASSKMYARATYDNTSSNPNNPNNPPKVVNAGEATSDEMMLVFFHYLPYQAGDENIIIDSTLLSSLPPAHLPNGGIRLFPSSPNPSDGNTTISWYQPEEAEITLETIDLLGRTAVVLLERTGFSPGYHGISIAQHHLAPGIYFIRLRSNENVMCERMVIGK
jgi:hypothetical protein